MRNLAFHLCSRCKRPLISGAMAHVMTGADSIGVVCNDCVLIIRALLINELNRIPVPDALLPFLEDPK